MEILLLTFAVDYISGVAASIKEGKGLRSTIGFYGLCKKGLMLLMVLLGHRIDVAFDLNIVMHGVVYFWLANELVSILENLTRCGLKTPPVFNKILTILKEKENSTDQK